MIRYVVAAAGLLSIVGTVAGQVAPATKQVGVVENLQERYGNIKFNLSQSAEAMPAADYGFKAGTAADASTFGQVISHAANSHFSTCAAVKGVPNPRQGVNLEKTLTSKADVLKGLADSFAFCDDAVSSVTDQSAMQPIRQGQTAIPRALALANLIMHSNRVYGTAEVYLRLKNITPPSERPAAQQTQAPKG